MRKDQLMMYKTPKVNLAPLIEGLEDRAMFSITTTTECVKVPGPTDTAVTIATNPAGHQVPGQSSTTTIANKDCHTL
jgi:hypothetical protein